MIVRQHYEKNSKSERKNGRLLWEGIFAWVSKKCSPHPVRFVFIRSIDVDKSSVIPDLDRETKCMLTSFKSKSVFLPFCHNLINFYLQPRHILGLSAFALCTRLLQTGQTGLPAGGDTWRTPSSLPSALRQKIQDQTSQSHRPHRGTDRKAGTVRPGRARRGAMDLQAAAQRLEHSSGLKQCGWTEYPQRTLLGLNPNLERKKIGIIIYVWN